MPVTGFSNSLVENMAHLFDLMDNKGIPEDIRRVIPWLMWNVWKNRNSILYAQQQDIINSVIQRAFEEEKIRREVNLNKEEMIPNVMRLQSKELRWLPPLQDPIKCNVNSTWRNASLHNGGAWIARDYTGDVYFHAREAFTCSPNRIGAELRCIIWTLQSLRDLRLTDVMIALDCHAALEAILKPT